MAYTIEQMADMLNATRPYMKKDALQTALTYQALTMVNNFFPTARQTVQGGPYVEWAAQLGGDNAAEMTSPGAVGSPTIKNLTKKGRADWKLARTHVAFNYFEELLNAGPEQLFDIMTAKNTAAAISMAELLNSQMLLTPTDSGDGLSMHGIFAYLCQPTVDPAGAASGAFTGYTPNYNTAAESVFNSGNLACSSTVNPLWANFYADHNNVLDDTIVDRLFDAFLKTRFMAPTTPMQALDMGSDWSKFRVYTNANVIKAIEKILRKSDDSIGPDLGKYAGNIVYKNVPFFYEPMLDATNTYVYGKNPIVGINHAHWKVSTKEGAYYHEFKPMQQVTQPDMIVLWTYLMLNLYCENRRQGGFLISEWRGA